MRYRAIKSRQALPAVSGKIKYQFENYVLDLGTGNTIDPAQASSNEDLKMQTPWASAATDIEKVGQDEIFIEAPEIIAAGSLTSGKYYEILVGPVDLTAAAYDGNYTLILPTTGLDLTRAPKGTVIKATAGITVPAGDDKWALTFGPEYLDDEDHNLRYESFIKNNLTTFKDESVWDENEWESVTQSHLQVRP